MLNKNLHENKFKRIVVAPFRNIIKAISKRLYISCEYRYITHHKLNFKNPIRYTEKLQYLRLFVYPKMELVRQCADRDKVRHFVKEKIGEKYLIKSYGVFNKFEDIDFNSLPQKFVTKCTHACAFNFICLDKSQLDIEKLRLQFSKWLKTNYGKKTCELHYSKIKPAIIIEEYIGESPIEYKIHVFNGVAKYMYVVTNRGKGIKYNNYYIDWTPFDGAQFNGWEKTNYPLSKPNNWEEMIKVAETLASPFPFVRVDLYNINGKIYFGEMTFTPAKGTLIFDDDQADFEIGKWLDISKYINAKKN